ncbi:hypothetical protein acsn021_27840 [Anaerocolumna cellulosilytica]|uniref:Uncharacterized protein n=1 Tax=Anaerocolumna cellulosilytica TaxID=433286 RepID=A0A6S6R7H5_9FIRM|nr:DUF6115 domain-containing protein [Anaerocolumna cellulosilytica]MBB5197001.1 hypothetical protein [Anaerocolumna cellulosilytica]BCJ95215.1 hypothetical protein acsn021_27840 [Anaerocolumna cellulosilytica]
MTPIVIFLILMGIAVIIISCFLVDKSNHSNEVYEALVSQRELSLTEIQDIKKKINVLLQEASEEAVIKVDDKLSQISNEKIIAVNDFSNQLLEKISQNHEEVVFLYNMLNEKETELKNIMKDIERVNATDSSVKDNTFNKQAVNEIQKIVPDKKNIEDKQNKKPIITEKNNEDLTTNHNQKILEMYSQGFSIVDISKTLELGQGEVKLVIDLYKDSVK